MKCFSADVNDFKAELLVNYYASQLAQVTISAINSFDTL